MISISLLAAIDFHQASGANITPATRDSVFSYHNGTDDHHWFGSDSWAVKYTFDDYSASFDYLKYNAEGAYIYFPSFVDSIIVYVCKDSVGQPGFSADSLLFRDKYYPQTGWNQIDFGEIISDSTSLWLVVDFETNTTNRFISGSANDGSHSYFKYNDYYYSLFSYSYESEFLFSLYGSFEVEGAEIELIAVNWNVDEFYSNAMISPEFVIRNNSDSIAVDAYLNFSLAYPDTFGTINLQGNVSGTIVDSLLLADIPANETIYLDLSDSLHYKLIRDGSQYEYSATLICPADTLLENNSYDLEFDTFNIDMEKIILENSLIPEDPNSNNILQVQNDLLQGQLIESINYFADESYQPFFTDDAYLRFSYYDLMGNPASMINGDKKIIGYVPTIYQTALENFIEVAQTQDSTFISSAECLGTFTENDDVVFYFELENAESYIFDLSLVNYTIYVAVVEELINFQNFPADVSVSVLRKIVGIYNGPSLSHGESFNGSASFNRAEDYETLSSYENTKIVYWLQDDVTKRVYFVESLPYYDLEHTDIQEEEIIHNSEHLQIFPNPYSFSGNMSISFSINEISQRSELKIYNIKGQLVRSLKHDEATSNHTFIWNGKDKNNKESASGVYLLQLQTKSNNKIKTINSKCLLLKK
jgi:FlgD Ig-like domain